ncbi:MAG: lipase maturation factor family protein, partial [Patescibacteria group bacterium]
VPFPSFITPIATIWLLIWIAFRLHLGSGLIKLRADPCWKDLTCLNYHFETQPIPSPLSPYWHFLPKPILKLGVLWTHFVQIIVPFFLFIPGIQRIIAGLLLLLFQIQLILSGNLSILNYISIVSIIAAFNDEFLSNLLPSFIINKANEASLAATPTVNYAAWAFFIVVIILSIPVVANLFSRFQYMNTSFNQFYLVNTYGAFGSVGRKRYELVVEGTGEETIDAKTKWKEYEFIAKPTNIHRKLPVIAPYQPRIDWQIWFAAMETPSQNPWMFAFIKKLLNNDKNALSLIAKNPFPHKPPKYIRVSHYIYKFAKPGSKSVWERELIGQWLPPLSKEDL